MDAVGFLRKIRERERVDPGALGDFVAGVGSGAIPDYQAAAFLMAVYCRGLDDDLAVALTLAMRDSGRVVDLSAINKAKVDKHSTGGVGDKISIPLAPLVVACGVSVPMISGRGLGHTGGTLDKLQSIPGFEVDLPVERFVQLVSDVGCGLIGQTGDLAPADKKLYALRDVTATVESIPLITASILSKKLAEGIDGLVLDVKVGSGAFMKTLADARLLAESLVRVGRGAGLQVRAVLTRMDEPLGETVGNALEVRESIAILRGEGPTDTAELTLTLGAHMLVLGGVEGSVDEARAALEKAMHSGAALECFKKIVEAQGGDVSAIDAPEKLPQAPVLRDVLAAQNGTLAAVDAYEVGVAAVHLGAGRSKAEDAIDPRVGFEVFKKVGSAVEKGELIARVHAGSEDDAKVAEKRYLEAVRFGSVDPARPALVIEVVE